MPMDGRVENSAPFLDKILFLAVTTRAGDCRKIPITSLCHYLPTEIDFTPGPTWKRVDIFTNRQRFLNASIRHVPRERAMVHIPFGQAALYKGYHFGGTGEKAFA